MRSPASPTVYFAIPGDINHCTGGYEYDRQLISGLGDLGFAVAVIALSPTFPSPDAAALLEAGALISALPTGATLIVDGLALGVMENIAQKHQERLHLIALCHHPLMLETGLTAAAQQSLHRSEQIALQACSAVIVTSEHTRTLLIHDFAIAPENLYVAVPGTDQQEFAPCVGDPMQLLTLATLTKRKGHDLLVAALAKISHLPWRARFVGGDHFDREWTRALHRQISAAGLTERIVCTGTVADAREEFLRADLFVLPSRFEGYGMAFAEALAFGLPIVATHTGAIPSVVPATAGILVPPNDTEALASALATLITDSTQRRALQAGARAAAHALPPWHHTASVVASVLKKFDVR